MKKILIGLGLFLLGGLAHAQNGLENVTVEKYYVSNAADATGSIGALPAGSVTYRIFADMLPGYKFQALYGVTGHALNITTSTSFFNNEDRGATTPNGIGTQYLHTNSVALDSWFSVGAAASGQMGVLKSEDNGAANLITGNTMLLNADASAGIPLSTQDGMMAGTPNSVTFVGLTTELNVFNATSNVGGSFTTSNGSIASLTGSTGPTSSNRVLVGQFTTNGNFHFDLNIQIGTPTNGVQNYVAHNPTGTQISIPSLVFDSYLAPPTVSTPVLYCVGATALPLTATAISGDTLKWYTVATGGTASLTAPAITTTTAGTHTYYVSQYKTIPNYGIVESARTPIVVTVSALPALPASITGPTNVCTYASSGSPATYTTPAVAGATYNWTVPATGATILSGQGTNSITVGFTSAYTTGNVAVRAINAASCASAYKTLVVAKTIPAAPLAIVGPTNVCSAATSGATVTYSIAAVAGATSYNWIVPVNATLVSGQGTTSITVTFSSTYTTGSIGVQSVVACGNSVAKTLVVTKLIPAAPLTITGPTNVCAVTASATPVTYTASAVAGIDSMHWVVPANATILSGWGTNSISVLFSSAYTTGSVSAQSCVVCGRSVMKSLVVTKFIPAAPLTITGPTNVCAVTASATPVTYTASAVAGIDSLHWVVPANATILSGWGTNSISVRFSSAYTTGSVSAQSCVVCGRSIFKSLVVTKFIPAAPVTISGPTNVCASAVSGTPVTYTASTVAGIDSLHWVVPANATILSGWGTNSISVLFSSAYTTGSVSAQSCVVCGRSIFKSLVVTKFIPAAPLTITGPANVCAAATSATPVTYTASAVAGVDSMHWVVPANATILSGWGTNSISVLFSSAYTTGSVSAQSCVVCGRSVFKSLVVTKFIPAAPLTITGPANVCAAATSATPVTYTASAVAGVDSMHWVVPANATILSGWGTNSISVLFSSAYTTGSVSVQSCVVCGRSVFKSLVVTKTIPAAPLTITGPANVCTYAASGNPVTYTASAVAGVDSLHWTVPANTTILAGWGTTSLTVIFSTTYTTGSISVQSCVVCGRSVAKSLVVTKTIPAAPLAITGPVAICRYAGSVDSASYTIAAVAGASSYTWTVPTGATITSGQGTTHIGVMFASNAAAGSVTCKSNAACGSSVAKVLAVTKTLPNATTITGSNSICAEITAGTSVPYTISAAVPNASSYTWAVPTGATVTSGQGTSSVTVHFATTTPSGSLVKVAAVNSCATSAQVSYAVTTCLSPIVIESATEASSTLNSFSDLYPNPSTEYFKVDINTDSDKDVVIMVFDVNGNKVIDQKHSIVAGATTIKTDFDKFSNGVYFVRIVDLSNNSVETRKLVK